MSGIVGIVHHGGRPVERAVLDQMTATLVHRGPDGTNVWSEGAVGLGHLMLWTTPESQHERQPLVNARGDLVLTADARIDNRSELIRQLDLAGRPAGDVSDSDLILAAYEEWGQRCPEHLLGDFAFAVWDARHQKLFCAVDHMGIRPFFYHHSASRFAFGSQIRALYCLPDVPRQVNEASIASHLTFFPCHNPGETIYHGVNRLLPGHRLTVTPDGLRVEAYWRLDPTRNIYLESDAAYAEAFGELFTEAVRCRLRSAYPVGIRLSGGLDSCSVAAVARTLLDTQTPLHTFTAYFPGEGNTDERPFVNDLLSGGQYDAHHVDGTQFNPLDDIQQVLAHHDEPVHDPLTWLDWHLSKMAHDQSVRLLLDGIDGDATVAPIGLRDSYLPELLRTGRWRAFWGEVEGHSRRFGASRRWTLLRFGLKPFLPGWVVDTWARMQGRYDPNPLAIGVIHPDLARRVGVMEKFEALGGYFWDPQRTARQAHFRQATERYVGRVEMMHRVAAPFSVECRHPFADKRLMEFCLALPAEQKLFQGLNRMVMRRALAHLLPASVQQRPGKGRVAYSYPRQLLNGGPHFLAQRILNDLPVIDGYVDPVAVRRCCHRYVELGEDDEWLNVERVVTLALWLRPELAEP